MKKAAIVLVIVMCAVTLFALAGCQGGFMSKTQTSRLYKQYGRPEAEMTIKYTQNSTDYEVKVVYSLLMDKAPVAVCNFIALVNSGAYENTILDSYNDGYKYMVMGRYKYEDERYYDNTLANQFVGEFKSNAYPEPKTEGGYAKFSMFSLAMYHQDSLEDTYNNTANGALILALAGDGRTFNSNNYAVFAELKSLTFSINGTVVNDGIKSVPADIISHFSKFSSSSQTVYESKDGNDSRSVSIITAKAMLGFKMVDTQTDWSKLPYAVQ